MRGEFGFLLGQIFLLAQVINKIEQLRIFCIPFVEQLVIAFADGRLRMGHLHRLMPHHAINAALHFSGAAILQHGFPTSTFGAFGKRGVGRGKIEHGCKNVVTDHGFVAIRRGANSRTGNNQRNAQAALAQITFATAENVRAPAVVAHINNVGVVGDTKLVKFFHKRAHARVQVFRHGRHGCAIGVCIFFARTIARSLSRAFTGAFSRLITNVILCAF